MRFTTSLDMETDILHDYSMVTNPDLTIETIMSKVSEVDAYLWPQ